MAAVSPAIQSPATPIPESWPPETGEHGAFALAGNPVTLEPDDVCYPCFLLLENEDTTNGRFYARRSDAAREFRPGMETEVCDLRVPGACLEAVTVAFRYPGSQSLGFFYGLALLRGDELVLKNLNAAVSSKIYDYPFYREDTVAEIVQTCAQLERRVSETGNRRMLKIFTKHGKTVKDFLVELVAVKHEQ